MKGNTDRYITISDIGGTSVYYFFDDGALEESMPTGEFSWWFTPIEKTQVKTDLCDCGGFKTYDSYADIYHSIWCKSRKENS